MLPHKLILCAPRERYTPSKNLRQTNPTEHASGRFDIPYPSNLQQPIRAFSDWIITKSNKGSVKRARDVCKYASKIKSE